MTGETRSERKLPLEDEAKARGKWRGGETLLEGDSDDLGLPASEVDNARLHRKPNAGGRPGEGPAGDFPPPD